MEKKKTNYRQIIHSLHILRGDTTTSRSTQINREIPRSSLAQQPNNMVIDQAQDQENNKDYAHTHKIPQFQNPRPLSLSPLRTILRKYNVNHDIERILNSKLTLRRWGGGWNKIEYMGLLASHHLKLPPINNEDFMKFRD